MKNRILSSRILSILLALCLAFATPLSAMAEGEDTSESTSESVVTGASGGVTLSLDTATGVLTLSGTGATTDSSKGSGLPEELADYQSSIKSVVVEDGVTGLGSRLFYNCSNLTTVDMSANKTLETLGDCVFQNCTSLTSITLPASVTTIGFGCFLKCSSMVTADLSATQVTALRNRTFTNCYIMETIKLPITVKDFSVADDASSRSAFYACGEKAESTSVYYPGTEAEWAALMASTDPDNSYCATQIGTYSISVICSDTTVDDGDDSGKDDETETTNPNGTTGDVKWVLDTETGVLTLSAIENGTGATADYSSADSQDWATYKDIITKVVIEEGVTKLGNRLFYHSKGSALAEVVFPVSSLTTIGEGTFRKCTSLVSITLPSSLTSIGRVCFFGDTALETLVIDGTMTTLPDELVEGCTALKTVHIPKSVTNLTQNSTKGYNTFYGCSTPETIYFGGTINEWMLLLARGNSDELMNADIDVICSDGTYNYNPDEELPDPDAGDSDEEAVLNGTIGEVKWKMELVTDDQTSEDAGKYVLTIYGEGAADENYSGADKQPWLDYADSIVKIVIEEGVTTVGDRLFYYSGGSALEEVVFPENSLTSIELGAFRNSTSLTSITLPDSLTYLGRVAFYDCKNLESLVFGGDNSKLDTLYDQTITNCNKLTTITLPASMTNLVCKNGGTSVGPFYKNKITTIYYGGTVSDWEALLAGTYADEIKSSSIVVYCKDGIYIDGSLGNGVVYSLDNGVLIIEAKLGDGEMPDFASTSDLPWAAEAETITKVIVKNSITRIGANAFGDCVNISEVVYVGDEDGWNSIKEKSGENNDPLFNVAPSYLTSGVCGDNAVFTYDPETKCLTISGTGAVYDYTGGSVTPWGVIREEIESLVVCEGITYLGNYLFNKAYSLSSVTLPEGLTKVGLYTFGYCTALKEVTFSEGLEIIVSKAFSNCSALETVTLPSTLEAVDMKAFENASALTDVYYNGTEGDWNQVIISTQAKGNAALLNANIHYLKSVQTFTDVAADSACYEAVTYLTDNGYLTVAEEAFGVDEAADMDMILGMLYVNAGSPGMYDSAWDWAVCNGLVDSGINAEITLSDLAVVLYRTAVLNQQVVADESVDEVEAAMAWCTSQQYFAQIDTNDQAVTRGEAALVMAAYFQSEASDADRNGEQLAILKEALAVEGGDGNFYIYAPDLSIENATTKRGDCIFILFPDGQTMLIDTAVNTSEAIVLKMLEDLGITHLDYLMFSHSDSDHVGNGVAVLNYLNGNVDKMYLNNAAQYSSIIAALPDAASKTTYLRRGDSFEIGEVKVQILNPTDEYIDNYNAGKESENNDSSIAVKFTYGESTFLTCGDLYTRMEKEVLSVYGDALQADIMKANHHAAYTSNCDEWVDTVNPQIIFAETDDNGTADLVNSAAEKGIAYYTFGLDGSILITMDNSRNYEVLTQKDSVLRSGYTGEVGKVDGVIEQSAIEIQPVGEVTEGDADFTLEVSGGADELSYQFTSSDESVVTVDENGNVHIVGAGTAVITVTKAHDYYETVYAEVTITVVKAAATEPVVYTIISGANSAWTKGSQGSVVIVSDGVFAEFTGLKIDGKEISEYTAAEGSTVVTLSAAYLETLSEGIHTVTFVFADQEVSTGLTIVAASSGTETPGDSDEDNDDSDNNNESGSNAGSGNSGSGTGTGAGADTGDHQNNGLMVSLLVGAMALAAAAVILKKKYNMHAE